MTQQIFNYRIYSIVYDDIKNGKKNIEFRLLNEKTERITNGDIIKFSVVDEENKSVIVRVIDKIVYDNLEQLWNDKSSIENNILEYKKEEFINAFNNIFGKDKVDNSKIVGIKFELV